LRGHRLLRQLLPVRQSRQEAGNGVVVDWRLPKEGAPIWFDTFAIPKSAKNVEEAHEFLNTLLDPKVIAPISDFLGYPNANKDSIALINKDITGNPNLTPTSEALENLVRRATTAAKA
jgi:putrescine transport system substrate-binding protein